MRVIEKRWKFLEEGYKQVNSLSIQLDSQWERSVQVAHRRKFKREVATWNRNRWKFLLLVLGFGLGCSLLCGFAYYAEEWNLQCLYSFWAFILLLLGIATAFFGRKFVRSVFQRPVLDTYTPPSQRLLDLWWKNLAPQPKPTQNSGDEGIHIFLDLLESNLANSYIAVPEILTSIKKITDTDILLLGPSGIWAFEVKHWYGTVYKMDGVWWQMFSNRRIDHLQDSGEQKQGPDEQWLNQVREIKTTLERRRAELFWIADKIQGGIVFSNPAARIEKPNIRDSSVAYGKPTAWLNRILKSQTVKGVTLDVQLQVLDALIEYGLSMERENIVPASAIKLAEWAYQKISQELTEYVEQWVK